VTQYATCVLTLPHNIPSGFGKAHPFPTDLLTQQVQVTVELYPVNQIWTTASGGTAPPTTIATASFVVQQVTLNNAGDALARRVDMASNAYAFPCEFVQQKQLINLANTAASQSVVLTGFRSGEVRAIHCWLSRSTETALNTGGTSATAAVQPFKWYLPTSVIMTYAGDKYAVYENSSSPLWNLINGDKSPSVDNLSVNTGALAAPSAFLSQWVELPFAQTLLDEDAHTVLVHGKPITNGIVNIDIITPSAQADWQLNVSYLYNATLMFSQGTVDYVF